MTKKTLKLTVDEVKHVAELARLKFSPQELKKFQKQLAKIFDYINLIGEMKTRNTAETSHPTGTNNIFREDELDKSKILQQDEALSNTPNREDGLFKIKKIFEE